MSKNKNISGDLILKVGFEKSILILSVGLELGSALMVMGY